MVTKGTAILEKDERHGLQFEDPMSDTEFAQHMARKAMEQRYEHVDRMGDSPGAINRVNGMKEAYGNGVSTLVMLYNATGVRLTKVGEDDHSGKRWTWPYDNVIENGQWSVFLHVKSGWSMAGSTACLGYKLEGLDEVFVIAWDTPYSGDNTGWCQVISGTKWNDTPYKDFHKWSDKGEEEEIWPNEGDPVGTWRTHFVASQDSSALFECVVTRSDIGYLDQKIKTK